MTTRRRHGEKHTVQSAGRLRFVSELVIEEGRGSTVRFSRAPKRTSRGLHPHPIGRTSPGARQSEEDGDDSRKLGLSASIAAICAQTVRCGMKDGSYS